MIALTEKSRVALMRLQKAEKDYKEHGAGDESLIEDPNFKKYEYVPSKENDYTVTGFTNNVDTAQGILGKPMIWMYRYKHTLLRCRLLEPEFVEEVICFEAKLKYKLTFDILPSTTVDLINDFVECKLKFIRAAHQSLTKESRHVEVVNPVELHKTLIAKHDTNLPKYPAYVAQLGRYPVDAFEENEL